MSQSQPLRSTNPNYTQLATTESSNESQSFHEKIGSHVLLNLTRDAKLLFLSKSIRLFSFGFLSVILVVYLQLVGISQRDIGIMFTLTLLGDMLISLYLTGIADKGGRRRCLIIGSTLSFGTGFVFATQTNYWLLLIAAIFGVISPSGNEIGPFMAIELASLAQVTPKQHCTLIMAWYNLFGCFSSGFGALFCGFSVQTLQQIYGWSALDSCRFMMVLYACCQLMKGLIFFTVSSEIEVPAAAAQQVVANNSKCCQCCNGLHKSRGIVFKLSALFCVDSFAGAFVLQSFISAWFVATYHSDPRVLGAIVFTCNLVAGVSALFAAPLAHKIGLILTMAVTHLPSNILLILVPLMPNEHLAIAMICLRYCISQMDVPTRNAYVSEVVAPEERSSAQGVTNVVRSLGAAIAPYVAERLYMVQSLSSYPFFIAGGLKIVYDIAILYSFHSVQTEQEKLRFNAQPSGNVDNASAIEMGKTDQSGLDIQVAEGDACVAE